MELHLSRNCITHTILSASSPGHSSSSTPLYHIHTGSKAFSRAPITISRISPSIAHKASYHFHSGDKSDIKESRCYDGGVQEFARVRLKTFRSSEVEYEGSTRTANRFLPSAGLWSSDRKFTASDGNTYTWHHGKSLLLKRKGSKKIEVARFHDSFGGFGHPFSSKLPYLEIRREGMHILDLIVVTWVVIASGKREEEQTATVEAAAGVVEVAVTGG